MSDLIDHLKRWNKWRKRCINSTIYKFLVLIGIAHSPTFALMLTDEEEEELRKRLYGLSESEVDNVDNG